MAGLARICKLYGAMVINGQRFVWDYATDRAVPEHEMTAGWLARDMQRAQRRMAE